MTLRSRRSIHWLVQEKLLPYRHRAQVRPAGSPTVTDHKEYEQEQTENPSPFCRAAPHFGPQTRTIIQIDQRQLINRKLNPLTIHIVAVPIKEEEEARWASAALSDI